MAKLKQRTEFADPERGPIFSVRFLVAIVLMVIAIGWGFINPANHTPFIPEPTTYTTPLGVTHAYGGIMGILGAAGVVFFAYIGFDAVSTAAQEAKNPKRDMPIGILGSLVICTLLYVLFSYVLSGVATVEDFRSTGREASVAFAISKTGWGPHSFTAMLGAFASPMPASVSCVEPARQSGPLGKAWTMSPRRAAPRTVASGSASFRPSRPASWRNFSRPMRDATPRCGSS